MSSHTFSDEQLIAFALSELDADQSERVASHIAECDQCRATVAGFRDIRSLLREDDTVAVPPATLARAQAIFRQHASIAQPSWLDLIRRGSLPHARQLGISTLVTVLLTLTFLYGSARLAAPVVQATVPGDALYPVKTTIEDVRVAVALDDAARVQTQLSIAQARVTEINALVAQGRYDLLPETTHDYSEHVQEATATLDQVLQQDQGKVAPGQMALAQKAEQALARYEVSLAVLQENSPGDVKPQIHQAVIASAAAKSTVQSRLSSISSPSGVTPTAPMTPGPGAVVTAPGAPPPPVVTNTLAPAPTVVITQPGGVGTLATSTNSPTSVSATPSKPTSSATPAASLTAATKTTIPLTPTALSTGTSIAPTGTPSVTMTTAPTSTVSSTATASATVPASTNTLAVTATPTTTFVASTPTLVPWTPTPAPFAASQTALPATPSSTPITASVTSTPSAESTATLPAPSTPATTSSASSSAPAPAPTSAPVATPAVTGPATPTSWTPSASSIITLTAPTATTPSGNNSPSAGASSPAGTKPLPVTPRSSTSSTALPPTPPAGPPSVDATPTVAAGASGTTNPSIAPTARPPIQTSPTAIPPIKAAMPTLGLMTDLVSLRITVSTR